MLTAHSPTCSDTFRPPSLHSHTVSVGSTTRGGLSLGSSLVEDFVISQGQEIFGRLFRIGPILTDKVSRRPAENKVDLFQGLPLCLRHEEDLVEPADDRDGPVEPNQETRRGHRFLHAAKVVRHEERTQEQSRVRSGHAVTSQVGRVDLGRDDPGETGVRSEEGVVQDQPGQVSAFDGGQVLESVELEANTDENEADEETRERGNGPKPTSESFHVQDGRNGAEQQSAASNERHVVALFLGEANLTHEDREVVQDGVATGELSQEHHNGCIDNGTARPRLP